MQELLAAHFSAVQNGFGGLIQQAQKKVSRALSLGPKPEHFASYEKGAKVDLKGLFTLRTGESSRALFNLDTLAEEREYLPDGRIQVSALFRLGDFEESFESGDGRFMYSGSVISAKFILGKNKGEIFVEGVNAERLPGKFLLFWLEGNEHGTIFEVVPMIYS